MKMKTKKSTGSSQPERLVRKSEADIERYIKSPKMKRDSEHLRDHLQKHGREPSPQDLAEIPELTEEELNALRPAKEQLTIRLDRDVLAWLKSKPGAYQTRLNDILRAVMVRDRVLPVKAKR